MPQLTCGMAAYEHVGHACVDLPHWGLGTTGPAPAATSRCHLLRGIAYNNPLRPVDELKALASATAHAHLREQHERCTVPSKTTTPA